MRDAAASVLVLASLTGSATAELRPEDPYPDVAPAQIEVDAISGVGGLPKPEVKPEVKPTPVTETASIDAEEWWEDQDLQIGGGVGFGLLVIAFAIRGRRRARRRALELANRRTQFGMSAVNPSLAQHNVAAWERGPAIVPAVINPEMLSNREGKRGMSDVVVAPAAQPYHGYSRADLAAYGMGPQVELAHSPAIASPASLPPLPVSQPTFTPPSTPVIPPPVAAVAPDLRRCHMPWASPASLPSHPGPFAAVAHAIGSQPPQPAPYAAGMYAAAPSVPSGLARTSHPFAPVATASQPSVALLQPASYAPQAGPRRARLAEGTPQPPIANPQPFVALPPPAPPVAHLAATQFAPSLHDAHDSESTTHFAPAELPRSFVLEMSATDAPAYPLTFPAYPDVPGSELAPIEPSGLNYWGPSRTDVDMSFESVPFARGSQPVEQLEPIRVALPQASTPDAETRIAPAPVPPSPSNRRTFRH